MDPENEARRERAKENGLKAGVFAGVGVILMYLHFSGAIASARSPDGRIMQFGAIVFVFILVAFFGWRAWKGFRDRS